MNMNNDIKITYRGKHVFDLAMKLAFTSEYENAKPETVVGYEIFDNSIYLYSYCFEPESGNVTQFPYKLSLAEILPFVWGWLQTVKPSGQYPDTDGSVEQGFTITTDGTDWRGSKKHGSFIAIRPEWIIYGK
jgi:hypothetical protein